MSVEIVEQILLLRPVLLAVIGETVAAYVMVLVLIRTLRVEGTGVRLAGLFVGLSGRSAVHLGVAWVKFAAVAAMLLLGRPLAAIHYLLLAALVIMTMTLRPRMGTVVTELAGGVMLGLGVAVCGTLQSYLRQIRQDRSILAAHWLLAAFLTLCALGLLAWEVAAVSEERTYFDESGETE